jgi:ABC-2 type transport system ATP-binding protein
MMSWRSGFEHVAIMARGRIAAVGTIARIRELLDEQPLSKRVDTEEQRRLAQEVLTLRGRRCGCGATADWAAARAFFTLFARLVIGRSRGSPT